MPEAAAFIPATAAPSRPPLAHGKGLRAALPERLWLICLALLLAFAVRPAHAGVANAPGANLEISLVTYGPGETYWERFGHDAIEVRDTASGEAFNFNYGVFDFDERGFLLNFARG